MPAPNILLLYSDQHRRDWLSELDLDFWVKSGGSADFADEVRRKGI